MKFIFLVKNMNKAILIFVALSSANAIAAPFCEDSSHRYKGSTVESATAACYNSGNNYTYFGCMELVTCNSEASFCEDSSHRYKGSTVESATAACYNSGNNYTYFGCMETVTCRKL